MKLAMMEMYQVQNFYIDLRGGGSSPLFLPIIQLHIKHHWKEEKISNKVDYNLPLLHSEP